MLARCVQGGRANEPDPVADETLSVAALTALMRAAHVLGEPRLLYAHTDWPRLIGANYAPGALAPAAAQRLTRAARQREWQHRLASRAAGRSADARRACLVRWGFA